MNRNFLVVLAGLTVASLGCSSADSPSGDGPSLDDPGFSFSIPPVALEVARGESVEILVEITREPGFTAAVEIKLVSPPAGIAASPVTIPSGDSAATLLVITGNDAAHGQQTLTIAADSETDTTLLLIRGPRGSLDESFGDAGTGWRQIDAGQNERAYEIEPDFAGGFYAGGFHTSPVSDVRPVITHHHADGSIDATFGDDGAVILDFLLTSNVTALAALPDDKGVLVTAFEVSDAAGSNIVVARLTEDGSLDPMFGGGDGWLRIDHAVGLSENMNAIHLLPDGGFLLAGVTQVSATQGDLTLHARLASGDPDLSFGGGDGVVFAPVGPGFSSATSIHRFDDGRILLGGYIADTEFALFRFTSSGVLDATFDGDGIVRTEIAPEWGAQSIAMGVWPDGRIVLAGAGMGPESVDSDIVVARYTASGALDATFAGDGIAITDLGNEELGLGLTIRADGGVVVGGWGTTPSGYTEILLVGYASNGALDAEFGDAGVFTTNLGLPNTVVNSVLATRDGRILGAGGAWDSALSEDQFLLARFWP